MNSRIRGTRYSPVTHCPVRPYDLSAMKIPLCAWLKDLPAVDRQGRLWEFSEFRDGKTTGNMK